MSVNYASLPAVASARLLTDEELEARALEYEEMARGCVLHAKEIREYTAQRASWLSSAA